MTAFEIFAAIAASFDFGVDLLTEFNLISSLQKTEINIRSSSDMLELRDSYRKASRIGNRGTLNRAGRDALVQAFWDARNNCSTVIEQRAINKKWHSASHDCEAKIMARQEKIELNEGW